jgi:hypothetical protein
MINTKGEHVLPMPESGRVLFWYGWPDDPENEDKKWLKNILQNKLFNVVKCFHLELVVIVKQY